MVAATRGHCFFGFYAYLPQGLAGQHENICLNNSGVDFINVTTTSILPPITATAQGCSPITPLLKGGLPTVINKHPDTGASFNFGQGTLAPTQFIVHSSGTRAYILASNLSNILVFNFDTLTTSSIQLSGNSVPIQASLSTDGKNPVRPGQRFDDQSEFDAHNRHGY